MLKVENLSFSYGPRKAIHNLNFSIGKGKIVGFLGPNGAGKTTTLKLVSGLVQTRDGQIRINNVDLSSDPIEYKKSIGFLPEHPPIYEDMVVRDYLNFVVEIKDVPLEKRKSYVDEALELAQLTEVAHRLSGRLSKGYRQRLGLAQAIVAKPQLIILDEPTVGFDPKQVVEFKNLLKKLKSNHSVLWSTHILADVEDTCDEVIVINKGKIATQFEFDAVKFENEGLSLQKLFLKLTEDPSQEER